MLGVTASHALLLKSALLTAAREGDALPAQSNEFGRLYELIFDYAGPLATGRILSAWIVENSTQIPRLVTCYPV
jgi:hypothetical protein